MKKFPIALQLYSVRDELAADFAGTLKKVKEMGYDGVEFAGLFEKTAEEVKAMCEENGLIPISAHVRYKLLTEDADLLKTYADIGCKYAVIPSVAQEYRPGAEKFDDFIETAKMLGAKAKELGMKLCFHNHNYEFEKIDGEYGLDIIYNKVPRELLDTELDTCWINVGGENPNAYIRKYADRVNIIHLKDYVGMYDSERYGMLAEGKTERKPDDFDFRPLGQGVMDFDAVLEAAEDVGVSWLVVEQDRPSVGKTPLECAESSIEYLKNKLGGTKND